MPASSAPDPATLGQLAAEVLASPAQVRQLGDRVYTLLQAELRLQRDRSGTPYQRLL